jgi:hypothetical protein
MLDKTIDLSKLKTKLVYCMTTENSKRIKVHLGIFERLLSKYALLRIEAQRIIDDIQLLLIKDNWLKQEVLANQLTKADDGLYRRCLFHFAKCIEPSVIRPSTVTVFNTNIDLLKWYRTNYQLGKELKIAIERWEKVSSLTNSTTLANAQKALQCLNLLCLKSSTVLDGLSDEGLLWFESVNNFRFVLKHYPIKDKHHILELALLSVLQAYKPVQFSVVKIKINNKSIDVSDLVELDSCIAEQLETVAGSLKYSGKKEHVISSVTNRFIKSVSSVKVVFFAYPETLNDTGLYCFKFNEFELLKQAKKLLSRDRFLELILLLEEFFGHEIQLHNYVANVLPFYFEKQKKTKHINFSAIYKDCPEIVSELIDLHHSETDLLAEKNYSMETLHTHFSKIKRLLAVYILPNYKSELVKYGFACMSMRNNSIQKAIFQQLQSDVQHKTISLRMGTTYNGVIRWLMSITNQSVVEVFKISFKRYQRHARRLKIEDLYSDEELKELVFYIEKGIREADSEQQLLALYFARIQIKSCWNTSPMSDIELSDIAEVAIPTAKKSITLLIQKPRKGYDVDTYSLDGRAVNSVMRDILFIRDVLTKAYRELGNEEVKKYLFIFKERANVYRLDQNNIVSHIKKLLNRLGCQVTYNSMRIRKNGANHLYREVAKEIRSYESVKLHSFDTFIQHYQRISEVQTQKTLHTAVDTMQRYFTGREIDPEIRVLMIDDGTSQKTPTGECSSKGNDAEAKQYRKEHRHLSNKDKDKDNSIWCSDFLACIWCKYFRTVADPDHVWQLLSYRDYVLSDMSASVSDIENNDFQQDAIKALEQRVVDILKQISQKNSSAVKKGQELIEKNGIHPFWAFAVTSVQKNVGDII